MSHNSSIKVLWICNKCGLRVPTFKFPVYCKCGNIGTIEEAIELTEENQKSLPSTARLAKNFAKATIKDIKHKFRRVSQEIYNKRLNICKHCPTNHVIKKNGQVYRCSHRNCGCFLSKKAWRESEKCPMGHWNE